MTATTPRRLSPEARREQILDAAERRLARTPIGQVSIVDIAGEAGVTPRLVQHYFHGLEEVHLALAARLISQIGAGVIDHSRPPDDVGTRALVWGRTDRMLEVIGAHGDLWLAMGARRPEEFTNPDIQALIVGITDELVTQTLSLIDGLIEDTPLVRSVMASVALFFTETSREWLNGRLTRFQATTLLTDTLLALANNVIPALERDPSGPASN